MSLTGYEVALYSNGSTSAGTTVALSGTIPANGTFTIVNGQADAQIASGADLVSGVANFNGDDYIELSFDGAIVDALGTYGNRVGWGANVTLVRKASISEGNPTRNPNFDRDVEWDSYSSNTFSFFASHTVDSADPTDPTDPTGPTEYVLISTIQGDGAATPLAGQTVNVEAVVTRSLPGLNGFFIQEESADQDDNDLTSEGLFVFARNLETFPAEGDLVRLAGAVSEFRNATQITLDGGVEVVSSGNVIDAVSLAMPFESVDSLEAYEGMVISFNQELVVTDNYNLGRFGQFQVSSQRLFTPTNQYPAGSPEAIALEAANDVDRLLIDDGNSAQNPDVVPFPEAGLSYDDTLRLGDSVVNPEGVLHYAFNNYNLIPTNGLSFVQSNPRTDAPLFEVEGGLRVASFNVLNYFNGPEFPTPRGADNEVEFVRQNEKLVSALTAIDADVLGLVEVENDGFGTDSAIAQLVNELNAVNGEGVYDYITVTNLLDVNGIELGGDAIKVGILYKPASVTPVGDAITIETVPFDFGNRPPVIQAFEDQYSGQTFTLAINHFRSKGSCSSATGGNADQNDGQACWNQVRVEAAQALMGALADNAETLGENILVMGDLNAYASEDPILEFESNGFTNLVEAFGGSAAYSYSFGGEIGYLDHALASAGLVEYVTGAQVWNINADEPRVFDYNTEFKSDNHLVKYFGTTGFRSSDHDPVIVQLTLPLQPVLGDFDGDRDVDALDIRGLITAIVRRQSIDMSFDFNNDGLVNARDIRFMRPLCTRARCAIR